jgi:hypothetical protein
MIVCVLLCARSASAQAIEAKLRPIRVGDAAVTGFVLPPQRSAAGFIIEVYEVSGGTRRFVDRKAIDSFEPSGEFRVALTQPAAADQRIELTQRGAPVPGGIVDVQPQAAPPAAVTAQLGGPSPGDQRISGRVLPPQGNASGFFVEIDDMPAAGPRFAGRYAITAFDAAGTFAITLTAPLAANQRVQIVRGGAVLDTVTVPAAPAAKPPQYRLLLLRAGERVVRGSLSPPPKEPGTLVIEVLGPKGELRGRKALTEVDAKTGMFSVTLDNALRSGEVVAVATATGTVVNIEKFSTRPALRDGLYDGMRIVRGRVEPQPGIASVRVRVLPSALENTFTALSASRLPLNGAVIPSAIGIARYVQIKSAPVNTFSEAGEFTVTLDSPLVAGQVVIAEAVTAGDEVGVESERITVTDPGSWGRARAYFAGGVVFSKDRLDFSKQDLTLALAIDKSILQKADFTLPAEGAVRQAFVQEMFTNCLVDEEPKAGPGTDREQLRQTCLTRGRAAAEADRRLHADGKFTVRQLNSFFDARLTQLPVVEPAPAAPAAGQTPATPVPASSGSKETGFRDSRKGAWMQVGAYAPVYGPQTSWVHEGAVNTIFVAPVFRFGVQTISSDDGTPTKNARNEPDDVFHFSGLGFAFGHQKLSGTTNQTPELISYLSIVWGHSETFEYIDENLSVESDLKESSKLLRCETTRVAVNGKVLVDPCRTMVEGRLRIPNTALQIGFNADLGDGHDDLRFVFGTRFDIGEAFARLRSFGF